MPPVSHWQRKAALGRCPVWILARTDRRRVLAMVKTGSRSVSIVPILLTSATSRSSHDWSGET